MPVLLNTLISPLEELHRYDYTASDLGGSLHGYNMLDGATLRYVKSTAKRWVKSPFCSRKAHKS